MKKTALIIQKLEKIKELVAEIANLDKGNYQEAVASCCAPDVEVEIKIGEEEMSELKYSIEDVKYGLQSVRQSMQFIWDEMGEIWRKLSTHINEGHLPPIKSVEQMNDILKTLGLDSEYVVEPQRIYATDGKLDEVRYVITKKKP